MSVDYALQKIILLQEQQLHILTDMMSLLEAQYKMLEIKR